MAPNWGKDTPKKSDEQPSRSPPSGLPNRPNGTNSRRNHGQQRPGLFGSMRQRFHMTSQWRLSSRSFINKTPDSLAASVASPTSDPTSRLKRLSSSLRGRTPDSPVHPSLGATRDVPSTVRARPHVPVPRESRRSISGPGALSTKNKPETTATQLEEPSNSRPPRLETNIGLDFRQSLMSGSWPLPGLATARPDPQTNGKLSATPVLKGPLARLPVQVKLQSELEQNTFSKAVSPLALAEDTPSKSQGEAGSGEVPCEKGKKANVTTSRIPVTWLDRVLETSSDLRGSSPERDRARDCERRLDWLLRDLESAKHRDPQFGVASRLTRFPCLTGDLYWNPRLCDFDLKLVELTRIMDRLEPQHRWSIESKLPHLIGYPLYSQFLAFYLMDEELWDPQVLVCPPPWPSPFLGAVTEANSPLNCKVETPQREAEAKADASSGSEGGVLLLRKLLPTLLDITNKQCDPENRDDPPSSSQLCYTPPPPEEDKDLMMASRIG